MLKEENDRSYVVFAETFKDGVDAFKRFVDLSSHLGTLTTKKNTYYNCNKLLYPVKCIK